MQFDHFGRQRNEAVKTNDCGALFEDVDVKLREELLGPKFEFTS